MCVGGGYLESFTLVELRDSDGEVEDPLQPCQLQRLERHMTRGGGCVVVVYSWVWWW